MAAENARMPGLVKPHGGGALKPLRLDANALAAERARAASLPALRVSSREKGDLIRLGIGGFTPLEGFMTRADWEGVCDGYRTASGLFWPIPITLSTDEALADGIGTGAEVALIDPDSDEVLATLRVTEKYRIDKAHECMSVFRTTDQSHPGVQLVMQQGEVNLAGPVKVLSDGGFKAKYGALFMTPAETRAEFERLGWSRVEAIASVGYDGSVAVDYRGDGDLTLGLLRSRSALELAITGGLAIAELLPELDEGEDEEEA
jgi:sulfate adenylyltransferase